MNHSTKINILDIRLDGGTQARAGLDQAVVDDYCAAILKGAKFPPIKVAFDGSDYWLVDGFHRLFAHLDAGQTVVDAIVTEADLRHAVLLAIGANDEHGLRRTNADKRHAVDMLLNDHEWRMWSQETIAEAANVSKSLVSKIVAERASLHGGEMRSPLLTVKRGGQTYQQNTAAIGRSQRPAAKSDVRRKVGSVPGIKEEFPGVVEKPAEDEEFDALRELEVANVELTALRKIFETDDKAAEALRWRNAFEVLDRRCNEHLGTIATRDRQIAFLSKQLRRCGAAVDELDTDKIGAAVERLVREAQEAP